jgi:acetoacetyl-CoA synthetase
MDDSAPEHAPTPPGEVLWRPERAGRTRLAAFRRHLAYAGVRIGAGYAGLHDWSVAERGAFWRHLWDFADVVGERGDVDLVDPQAMPGARFLPEARLNYAENLLRHTGPAVAVIGRDETGARETLDRDGLRGAVFAAMAELEALGLGPGDRVAAIVPNRVDTLVLMLAVTGLGGVWSSCSPDFGASAALDRFAQLDPVLLVGCDGYAYGGRTFDVRERLGEIAAGLPGVRATLVVPVLEAEPDLAGLPDARVFRRRTDGAARAFVRRAFDDPLYVMFSSGTTGTPKAIVHGHGGTLLQHLKEHQLHCDATAGDALCFFTTCGWMMWNWLVSALASGVAVMLWDGAPTHPEPDALFRCVEDDGLTHLGVSPGLLSALEQAGVRPGDRHDLRHLRCLLSTGSPLSADGFRWIHDAVGADVQIASITGGTDLMGCFALGCPELPVRAGEIQAAGLGMALAFLDEHGAPVRGRRGELVCTAPFPSMPVGFLGDADGARYRAAYFEDHPGLWTHGDFGEFVVHADGTPDGIVIHGRSDAVLNRGGVRIGTAELYRRAEALDEVAEALAIQRTTATGDEIVLFVRLADGAELDDGLRERLRRAIREGASPRHVPDRIAAVPEMPRTRSGKLVELAVREVVHGRDVDNAGALANPEALDAFRDHPDLR